MQPDPPGRAVLCLERDAVILDHRHHAILSVDGHRVIVPRVDLGQAVEMAEGPVAA